MKEIWKDVVGYEGYYQVSNLGRVKSLKREVRTSKGFKTLEERILVLKYGSTGYPRVNLSVAQKVKTKNVHRIEMEAFVPNPENKATINHKDGNRRNNLLTNLEWSTYSENITHSFRVLGKRNPMQDKLGALHPTSRQVSQYTLDGKFVKTYGSRAEAQRKAGISAGYISSIIDTCKPGKGFLWKSI